MKITPLNHASSYDTRLNNKYLSVSPHQKLQFNPPKTILFGSIYGRIVDTQISGREKKLEKLKNKLLDIYYKVDTQKAENTKELKRLDCEIENKKNDNNKLTEQIIKLTETESAKNKDMAPIKLENQNLEREFNCYKKQMECLLSERSDHLKAIEEANIIAQKNRESACKSLNESYEKVFQRDIDNALSSNKSILIQKVINPTVMESEGEKVKVPHGILIESEDSDTAKKVFEWLVKKTDSNYAIIDAAKFNDKLGLHRAVNSIADKSQKNFESNFNRTFTFIDNFDDFAILDNKSEDIIFKGFSKLLSLCSEQYHNTIVVVTKNSVKLDSIHTDGLNFPIKIKLNSDFLQDKKLGFESILNELKTLKSDNKNILHL